VTWEAYRCLGCKVLSQDRHICELFFLFGVNHFCASGIPNPHEVLAFLKIGRVAQSLPHARSVEHVTLTERGGLHQEELFQDDDVVALKPLLGAALEILFSQVA
jgi:hypothetical protein